MYVAFFVAVVVAADVPTVDQCEVLAVVADVRVASVAAELTAATTALDRSERKLTAWQIGGTAGVAVAFMGGTALGLYAGSHAAATGARAVATAPR